MDSERPADGSNPHQLGQSARGLVNQNPKFVDDDDEVGEGRKGPVQRPVSSEVANVGGGKQLLPAADLGAQGHQGAVDLR